MRAMSVRVVAEKKAREVLTPSCSKLVACQNIFVIYTWVHGLLITKATMPALRHSEV